MSSPAHRASGTEARQCIPAPTAPPLGTPPFFQTERPLLRAGVRAPRELPVAEPSREGAWRDSNGPRPLHGARAPPSPPLPPAFWTAIPQPDFSLSAAWGLGPWPPGEQKVCRLAEPTHGGGGRGPRWEDPGPGRAVLGPHPSGTPTPCSARARTRAGVEAPRAAAAADPGSVGGPAGCPPAAGFGEDVCMVPRVLRSPGGRAGRWVCLS